MYSPTRSARSASMRWPLDRTSSSLKMRPKIRATVVFPVPGLPLKMACKTTGSAASISAFLRCWISTKARTSRTSVLISSSPDQRVEFFEHLGDALVLIFDILDRRSGPRLCRTAWHCLGGRQRVETPKHGEGFGRCQLPLFKKMEYFLRGLW